MLTTSLFREAISRSSMYGAISSTAQNEEDIATQAEPVRQPDGSTGLQSRIDVEKYRMELGKGVVLNIRLSKLYLVFCLFMSALSILLLARVALWVSF